MWETEEDRQALLAALTGIHASKINYYSELKGKVSELEARNQQLHEAKQVAEAYCAQLKQMTDQLRALYQTSSQQALRLDRALASLRSISEVLTATTRGVDGLLQALVRTAAELFETDYAVVTLGPDPDAPRQVYCVYRLQDKAMPAALPTPLRDLVVAVIDDPRPLHEVSDEGQTYTLCVPMFREETLVGTLCLQTQNGHGFADSDLAILQTLANQAAVAIENARLFEETSRLHAETTRLYKLAVQEKEAAEHKRRELEQARLELSNMQKKQILTEERNRIARELHDSVVQILTSLGLNLEWCRQQVAEDSPVHQRIVSLKQLARDGIYEVRNTIFELSSVDLSATGLISVVEELAREFERTTGIQADLTTSGQVQRLPLAVKTALYRVTQEALYNTFKHAHASQVMIQIAFHPDRVCLQVTDDGVGIAQEALRHCQEGLTFGLKNMLERAEEVGGELSVIDLSSSGEGQGTRVSAVVPMPAPAPESKSKGVARTKQVASTASSGQPW